LAENESKDSESFLNREKKPWSHKSHLAEETRPSLRQRFPSRDIWEDSPDSLQLQTTVNGPQSDDKDPLSPPPARPTTGAVVYHQEKAAAGLPLASDEGRATTGIAALMKPSVPPRPARTKASESPERAHPVVPERPSQRAKVEGTSPPIPMKTKPVIPARPAKPITRGSSEDIPLTTVPSNSSAKSVSSDQGSALAAKPKPPVPSRPVGSKIAALQGGFMSDLNKRLQLGPQAPKKEEAPSEELEPEKEKAPLVDARKGRARGPARRAPAKSPAQSPAPVATAAVAEKSNSCSICIASTLFEIDPEEELVQVPSYKVEAAPAPEAKALSATPTTNTAKESLHEPSDTVPGTEGEHKDEAEETIKEIVPTSAHDEVLKSGDEPLVESALAPEPAGEEDLSESTATLKAESEDVVE
jgi:hypothetical protein